LVPGCVTIVGSENDPSQLGKVAGWGRRRDLHASRFKAGTQTGNALPPASVPQTGGKRVLQIIALTAHGFAAGASRQSEGTTGEPDHITVRSLDGLFSQRSAVEAEIDESLGKALSVQLGDQGVNDIHQTS
jgi:hypothetical protein